MVGGESPPLIPEPGYFTLPPPLHTHASNTHTPSTHKAISTSFQLFAQPHAEFVHFSVVRHYPRYIMSYQFSTAAFLFLRLRKCYYVD